MSGVSGRTAGFGAAADARLPHFRVILPPGRNDPVEIVEYRGADEAIQAGGVRVVRVRLERGRWRAIADAARREFNARLRAVRLPAGRWAAGETPLDRLLGRELCVLAWAVEFAQDHEIPIICHQWLLLRPEERWWLFARTAAAAGGAGDGQRGWRKALYHALSDGEPPAGAGRKAARPEGTAPPPESELELWQLVTDNPQGEETRHG